MVLYNDFIGEEGLQNILEYKYSHTGYTKLDDFLTPFWNGLVEYQPRNWAPNLITVFASLGIITPGLIFLLIDPSVSNGYPKILYLLGAFGFFVHQTLDVLDGKQARRIGASSPLGQLFDHGCDAFILPYVTIIVASSDGMGSQDHIFWGLTQFMTCAFFLMNWMEYHSHISATNVGELGVTEAQWIFMLFLTFNYVTGVGLAEITIFKGLTIGNLLYYSICYPIPFYGYYAYKLAAPHITDTKKAQLKLVPLAFLIISTIILSSIKEFSNFKGWVVIGYGSYSTLITVKQIVSGLARLEFQVLHLELVYLLVLSLLAKLSSDPVLKILIFVLIFVGGQFFFFDFAIDIVTKIAKKLKINILSLTPKKESDKKE